MQNWVMLNMLCPLQGTFYFFFHWRCLRAGMCEKKPYLAGLHEIAVLENCSLFFADLHRNKAFNWIIALFSA